MIKCQIWLRFEHEAIQDILCTHILYFIVGVECTPWQQCRWKFRACPTTTKTMGVLDVSYYIVDPQIIFHCWCWVYSVQWCCRKCRMCLATTKKIGVLSMSYYIVDPLIIFRCWRWVYSMTTMSSRMSSVLHNDEDDESIGCALLHRRHSYYILLLTLSILYDNDVVKSVEGAPLWQRWWECWTTSLHHRDWEHCNVMLVDLKS